MSIISCSPTTSQFFPWTFLQLTFFKVALIVAHVGVQNVFNYPLSGTLQCLMASFHFQALKGLKGTARQTCTPLTLSHQSFSSSVPYHTT